MDWPSVSEEFRRRLQQGSTSNRRDEALESCGEVGERMMCHYCVAEGEKSVLYAPTSGISTAMGWSPYYDEEGKYHFHDMNSLTAEYHCSRGHRYVETLQKRCPNCDWSSGETMRRLTAGKLVTE
jgi:hypothetical protein